MQHSKKKIERGLHFCRCGAAGESAEALERHCEGYNAVEENERKKREVAATAKRLSKALTVERDNKRRH